MLAILQRAGLSPDVAMIAFQVAAVAFASLIAARLYEICVGWGTVARKLGLVCFFWGGGVLSLAGAVAGIVGHIKLTRAFVLFDAGDG